MEPIIYKPGAYNTPKIYKCGTIYNGNGVYNSGYNDEKIKHLIYETNFSNFDVNTLKDYPIIGDPITYNKNYGTIEKTTRIIDGKELSCLRLIDYTLIYFSILKISECEKISVEFITNRDYDYGQSCNCALDVDSANWTTCPAYFPRENTYYLGAYNYTTPQDGFLSITGNFIVSDEISERERITQLSVCGSTFDKQNNIMKAFINGKKAATKNVNYNYTWADCVANCSNGSQLNIFGIRVYKDYDIYDNME